MGLVAFALLTLLREREARVSSEVMMWKAQLSSWEGEGRWEGLLARRSWPEWECQASLGNWGCGGSVKMGLGDCAGPNMERWAGRMERVVCLGTVMPLRVSVAGRPMRTDWEWMARR